MPRPTINEADVHRYTCGDCHIFARVLNEYTGWPVATFLFVNPWNGERQPDMHAFVLHPSGDPVDIEGRRSEAEFREAWSQTLDIVAWDDEVVKGGEWSWDWRYHTFGTSTYWRAYQLAPLIVEAAR